MYILLYVRFFIILSVIMNNMYDTKLHPAEYKAVYPLETHFPRRMWAQLSSA